ncbi:MAG: zf-HC2 domain-containing protein [Myxococcota bacterium]
MSRCHQIREDLVAYERGELDELRKQRVDAHLARCSHCRSVSVELARALEAGRAPIQVGALETEQLVERLGPWLDRRPADAMGWVATAMVAATAAAAAALMLVWGPASSAPLEHLAPQENLRIVGRGLEAETDPRSGGWRLEEGFAVVDGVAAPPIHTPELDLRPETGRTRFWVERHGRSSWFEVLSGELVVQYQGVEHRVSPGEGWVATKRTLRPGRAVTLEAIAHVADPFLGALVEREAPIARAPEPPPTVEPDAPPRRAAAPAPASKTRRRRTAREGSRTRRRAPEPKTSPTSDHSEVIPARRTLDLPDPTPVFERPEWLAAERAARGGRWTEALRRYRALADRYDGAEARFAQLERARILGLRMKRGSEARDILETLLADSTDDEVARQSRFTRCELLRKDDACAAQDCLRALESSPAEAEEARATLRRWSRSEIDCPDIKQGSSAN